MMPVNIIPVIDITYGQLTLPIMLTDQFLEILVTDQFIFTLQIIILK